jgi:hypothetical protein
VKYLGADHKCQRLNIYDTNILTGFSRKLAGAESKEMETMKDNPADLVAIKTFE